MTQTTYVNFDEEFVCTVDSDFVPSKGDVLELNDTENPDETKQYVVHSCFIQTGPTVTTADTKIDPTKRRVDALVVIVYGMDAATPDHDYQIGGLVENKYLVRKTDGTTDPNAVYFPLRLDTDPNALMALKVYADSVEGNGNPVLASDARALLANMREHQKRQILVDKK